MEDAKCDNVCVRCDLERETINHVLFECLPSKQVWALSNVSSPIDRFPGSSVWSNMDYLFWRVDYQNSQHVYPWILWNIWKVRNEKVYSNKDMDPRMILAQTEMEALEWFQANDLQQSGVVNHMDNYEIWDKVARPLSINMAFTGYRCFVDGTWKESDNLSGVAWSCFSDSVDQTFQGGRSIPRGLSSLHVEFEAVLWAMQCMLSIGILEVELATDCSDILKMISSPEDWPAFYTFLKEFVKLRVSFTHFSLFVIPRALNYRSDSLAKCFRG